MTTLILCLFIACLLPFLTKIPVALSMKNQAGGYDNAHPRAQQATLTGWGARAVAAHQNSFESLIVYTAAILTAIATQHSSSVIQNLAMLYLVSRFFYLLAYLKNWAGLRSTIWTIGYASSLAIIWLCLPV